jgi:hypothetical protein
MRIPHKYSPLVLFVVLVALMALLLPAVQHARPDAIQRQSINNVRQLLLAMHNYESQFKSLPPGYTASPEGKPLLSWRVMILPMIEEEKLFKEFHLDEPWDSPHNLKLVPRMPRVYASIRRHDSVSDGKGMTPYLTLRGPYTALRGPVPVRVQEVRDGLSNTVAIVEVLPEHEVVWSRPDDLDVTADGVTAQLQVFLGCFTFGRLDGDVWCPSRDLSDESLRTLADIRDGRRFDFQQSQAEKDLHEYLSRPTD